MFLGKSDIEGLPDKRNRKRRDLHGDSAQKPIQLGEEDDDKEEFSDNPKKKPRLEDEKDDDYSEQPRNKAVPKGRRETQQPHLPTDPKQLQAEFMRQQETLEDMRRKLSEIRAKRTFDRKQGAAEKVKRLEFQRQLQTSETEVTTLQNKLREQRLKHKAKVEELQDDFDEAQHDLHAKIKQTKHPSWPDDVVQHKFDGIMSKCRSWINKWHSWDSNTGWSDSTLQLLTSLSLWANPIFGPDLTKHILELGMQGRKLLLYTVLTRNIFLRFFKTPFVLSQVVEPDSELNLQLQQFYDMTFLRDEAGADSWRAETVHLLRGQIECTIQDAPNGAQSSTILDNFSERMARRILDTIPDLLRLVTPEESRNRCNQLSAILRDAVLLALDLWSRKAEIRMIANHLKYNIPFENGASMYTAHRCMQLEEDDQSLDGRLIQAVLTPGISVVECLHGQKSANESILSKAVILIIPELNGDVYGWSNHKQLEQLDIEAGNGSISETVTGLKRPAEIQTHNQENLRESGKKICSNPQVLIPKSKDTGSGAKSLKTYRPDGSDVGSYGSENADLQSKHGQKDQEEGKQGKSEAPASRRANDDRDVVLVKQEPLD